MDHWCKHICGLTENKQDGYFLTNTDIPLSEKRVHVVNICHEFLVTKGEVGHVASRLGSCQHLNQSCGRRNLC